MDDKLSSAAVSITLSITLAVSSTRYATPMAFPPDRKDVLE